MLLSASLRAPLEPDQLMRVTIPSIYTSQTLTMSSITVMVPSDTPRFVDKMLPTRRSSPLTQELSDVETLSFPDFREHLMCVLQTMWLTLV